MIGYHTERGTPPSDHPGGWHRRHPRTGPLAMLKESMAGDARKVTEGPEVVAGQHLPTSMSLHAPGMWESPNHFFFQQ